MGPALAAELDDVADVVAIRSPDTLTASEITDYCASGRVDTIVGFHFGADVLACVDGLRWLHLTGTGTDHLRSAGLPREVMVTNSPRVAVRPVAEYALAALLSCSKSFPRLLSEGRDAQWFTSDATMIEGATVGIVGVGRIGGLLARRLRAIGATVIAFTRTGVTSVDADRTFASDRLVEIAPELDHLVCCLPATEETDGIIDGSVISALGSAAIVVNVGRSQSIDTVALHSALRGGELRAAFVDVHAPEPLDESDPSWDVPNLIVSPHRAFAFPGEAAAVVRGFTDNLDDLRQATIPRDLVTSSLAQPEYAR